MTMETFYMDPSLSSFHINIDDTRLWHFSSRRSRKSSLPRRESVRRPADIVRFASMRNLPTPVFTPDVHSTPIVRNQIKFERRPEFKVPTISEQIDRQYCKPKIIKKRGIQGVSWVLQLASNDDTVGKIYRSQLSWIFALFFLFLTIGGLLGYFSKYISIDYFTFNATLSRNGYPDYSIIEQKYSDNNYSIDKTDEDDNFYSCDCVTKLEVCIVNYESGIPNCKQAIDPEDPTGCGGLCELETEACRLLHRKYPIYTCKKLERLTCEANEWRCANYSCIPNEQRCDGRIDCYDRSDELECDTCDLSENFQCGNATSCLDISKRCDGTADCWDSSDEFDCEACSDDQFKCTNGNCVPSSQFCDSYKDCSDASDEPDGCERKCLSHEFQCKNGRCISRRQTCDNTDDCDDGSDEFDCANRLNKPITV